MTKIVIVWKIFSKNSKKNWLFGVSVRNYNKQKLFFFAVAVRNYKKTVFGVSVRNYKKICTPEICIDYEAKLEPTSAN